MESVDPLDKWLDPPEDHERGTCDRCHDEFDNGDLNRITITPGNVLWLCDDCEDNWQRLVDSLEYDQEDEE
jgi:RNase P subunit RPR2